MPVRLRAGPFHGLAPYSEDEGDCLFGRDAARAAALSLARQPSVSTILLTGENGSGKTSLLRAGLGATAPSADVLPLYLELVPGWQRALSASLSQLAGRPVGSQDPLPRILAEAAANRDARPLLVVDHLDVLLWADEEELEAVRRCLTEFRRLDQLGVVLAFDRGNGDALARLGIQAIPGEHTVTLARWDRLEAGQVLERTILAAGGYMEAGLPQLIADELSTAGPLLPAALQVAGHAAVLHRVADQRSYSRAGGARALTTFYVQTLTSRAGAWPARRALAVFSEQPSPYQPLAVDEVARAAGLEAATAAPVLEALEREGLLRSHQLAADGPAQSGLAYSVLHPYLMQPIRDYVAAVRLGRARARMAARRVVHRGGVLWPWETLSVWRFLGRALDEEERRCLRRSARFWGAVVAALAVVPLITVLILYLMMSSAAHLDVGPAPSGASTVVLQSGDPSLDCLAPLIPGRFHELEVDTGLELASLPVDLARQIQRGTIGDRLRSSAPLPDWARQLASGLPSVRRAVFLILAQDLQGRQLLRAAAEQPGSRKWAVIWATLLLDGGAELKEILSRGADDPRPEVRLLAIQKARNLGPQALPLIHRALRDPASEVRQTAIGAIQGMGAAEALPLLRPLLLDPDLRVQREAMTRLASLARAHPSAVLDLLLDLGQRPEASRGALGEERERLQLRILASDPKPLASHLVSRLAAGKTAGRQETILQWLASVADQLSPDQIRPALARLTEDRNPLVRAAAISLSARFDPPDAAQARLIELVKTGGGRAEATAVRRAAAIGLGLIKSPLTRERYNLLKGLVRDREQPVRAAAVHSLLRSGELGLLEVARAMKAGPPDVAQAALHEICEGQGMSTRVSTTILGVVWKLKRQSLRQRALVCAQSLGDASIRLRIWLADQAARDKDHQVRRAGAAAAAMALRDGGAQHLRLGRLYLRDPDPELRLSMLQAISKNPPARPAFLFELVEKLSHDSDVAVRAASVPVLRLSAQRPGAMVEVLKRMLLDADRRVQRVVIEALGKLAPDDKLRAALEGPMADYLARAPVDDAPAAIRISGRLRLIGALRRAAAHSDGGLRAAALEAMAPLLGPQEARSALGPALRDSSTNVRRVALRTVARLDLHLGEPAARLLAQVAQATPPDAALRAEAFRAMGQLRGTAAVAGRAWLERAARHRSEEYRRLAIGAIGELAMRDPDAVPALAESAEDQAVDVRREAQSRLAAYLGRYAPLESLSRLLLQTPRNGLARRLAVAALVHHARHHGTHAVRQALGAAVTANMPLTTRLAANLVLALLRSREAPDALVRWFYGA